MEQSEFIFMVKQSNSLNLKPTRCSVPQDLTSGASLGRSQSYITIFHPHITK